MIHKIKAFTLLLSFMMVLGHMMVPHHHHESLAEIEKVHDEQIAHTHHHGSNHHHHDHEEQDSDHKGSDDQKVPQHFHFSISDNFEPLRIDHDVNKSQEHTQPTLAIVHLFSWDADEFDELLTYPNFWPDKRTSSQNKPGANGLRAPPSIA